MAKRADQDLFDRLRAGGLRKRVASSVTAAVSTARRGRKPPKQTERIVAELKSLAAEIEDRAKGGPARRQTAAKKAAATRKRNAAKRSTAAKKAARTRAKSKS
jgi:hypothetical protein